jgi:hypothetical protein
MTIPCLIEVFNNILTVSIAQKSNTIMMQNQEGLSIYAKIWLSPDRFCSVFVQVWFLSHIDRKSVV